MTMEIHNETTSEPNEKLDSPFYLVNGCVYRTVSHSYEIPLPGASGTHSIDSRILSVFHSLSDLRTPHFNSNIQ